MGSGLLGYCPCLPVTLIYVLLLLLAFLTLSTASSNCKVELCSRQYAHAIDSGRIDRGPTYSYCRVLKKYNDCLNLTSRSCRGNLEFHSIISLIMQWYNEFNCPHILSNGQPDSTFTTPFTTSPRPTPQEECMYRGRSSGFSHCALFGDPHLRTFSNDFQTCRVLGAWPLIDNPYLAVQVTNEAVHKGSSATATSKVTIIIRDHGPCTKEKMYEAQSDSVPSVFVDGTRISHPDKSVRIREENPGRHVEISIRHIATRIIIRQVGRYLTLAIRMPNEVASLGSHGTSLELCARGCPKRERIDYAGLLANPSEQWLGQGSTAVTVEEAVTTCRHFNVTDHYFDACVFDLLTTGDSSFGRAAEEAAKDVITLNPALASSENRTYLLPDVMQVRPLESNAPGRPSTPLVIMFLLVVLINRVLL